MDWWMWIGTALVLIIFASIVEEHLDHPDWLADAPVLRWTANTVVGAVTVVAAMLGLYASVLFWQAVGAVLFAVGVLWLLYRGVLAASKFLSPGGEQSRRS